MRTILRPILLGVLAVSVVVTGCAGGSDEGADAPSTFDMVERADWAEVFQRHGVAGTFVLHQLGEEIVVVHDPDRAAQRELPASTFKVLNSLIALETGAVADVDELVEWDRVERSVDAWNQDHSLRSGIEVSAVWAYQELARLIGTEEMGAAVDAAGYGNTDIGGPIEEFWLRGDLRISPIEQLDLLASLLRSELPFAQRHQSAVTDILVRESGDDWVWGHKTGTALAADPILGWLVGYTTFGDDEWVFAMNLDLVDADIGTQIEPEVRTSLSREILVSVGALPVGYPASTRSNTGTRR